MIFNLFEQRPTRALLPAAATSNTAVIDRVAFDSGSLSGLWTPKTYDSWEDGSQQKEMFRDERFTDTLRRVEALKTVIAPYYSSLAEAAVKYVLSSPEVSTVIAGMSSSRNIARNVGYSDGTDFPEELRVALADHEWIRDYYH